MDILAELPPLDEAASVAVYVATSGPKAMALQKSDAFEAMPKLVDVADGPVIRKTEPLGASMRPATKLKLQKKCAKESCTSGRFQLPGQNGRAFSDQDAPCWSQGGVGVVNQRGLFICVGEVRN